MKSYKEMRKTIAERTVAFGSAFDNIGSHARVGPLDGDNSVDGNTNLSTLTPNAISRINTYLGAMSAKPYIDPVSALKQAQGRLQIVGLDFSVTKDCAMRLANESEEIIPLVRFGGSLRADGSVYGYTRDDGITPLLGHGLALKVETHKLPNGLIQVDAMIVPNG
jgi:hypothetical protein